MSLGPLAAIGRRARRGGCACALVFAATTAHPASLIGEHGDTTKTFITRSDVVLTGGAVIGTASLTRFDTKIARWWISPGVQDWSSRSRVVGDLTHVNETTLTAAAILSYGLGRLVHSPTFPSLHSATAYAAPILYTAAAVPGLTRMYLNQHWASDIAAGAFVGTLLGNRVVHYAHSHKRSKLDRVLLGVSVLPDGHGGGVAVVTVWP